MTRPRQLRETRSAVLGGTGEATVDFGAVGVAQLHHVRRFALGGTSDPIPRVVVSIVSGASVTPVASSFLGTADASMGDEGLTLEPGENIRAVWTGGQTDGAGIVEMSIVGEVEDGVS